MITAAEFRKGTKFFHNNEPHVVVDFQHSKIANRRATVKVKMRNLISGSIYEETFRVEDKFDQPDLKYRPMQYLYHEGDDYHFMDQENYDQVVIKKDQMDGTEKYIKEGVIYTILFFEERAIEVNPPTFVELLVTQAPPGVRGDTAQGSATKPATLETGMTLQVPLFVNEGDVLKIDTRTGAYIERVNKK